MNTSFFHIMSQGINKEYIFNSEDDKEKYMRIMKDTKEKIPIIILAYCVMNNHIHILFNEKNVEQLTKYMHKVNLLYAKYYNRKYDRVGYVFRDRFKVQPIYTEKYLCTCVKYIHDNPVKVNICQKAQEYKYSSCVENKFDEGTKIENNIRKLIYLQNISKDTYDEFTFLEVERDKLEICKEVFGNLIKQEEIKQEDLINNKELLRTIVKKMKDNYKISFRTMEKVIGIGRETLRRIIQ